MSQEKAYQTVNIEEIFSREELMIAWQVYRAGPFDGAANRLTHEFVRPRLGKINERLGGQNDPRFIAYVIIHAFITFK